MSTTSIEHSQLGREQADVISNVHANLTSLRNIIEDISLKLNHQVLGNCDILERVEREPRIVDDRSRDTDNASAMQVNQVRMLIVNPIKLTLGRLNGIKKIISQCQDQLVSIGK